MKWMLILFLPFQSFCATYYVATNGNNSADGSSGTPWLTVSNGLARIVAGDTLKLTSGQVFTETNLFFSKSGSAASPFVITTTSTARAIVASTNGHGLMMTNANWVTIDNLSFLGNPTNTGNWNIGATDCNGILLDNHAGAVAWTNLVIQNCEFSLWGVGIFSMTESTSGRYLNWTISTNYIHDCNHAGIELISNPATSGISTNVTISYNWVTNMLGLTNPVVGGVGIYLRGNFYNALVERNLVTDLGKNTGGYGGTVGIEFDDCNYSTIQWNEVARVRQGWHGNIDALGIDLDYGDNNCTVQWNYIHDCDGAGLQHEAQGNNIFRFNVVNNCGGWSSTGGGFCNMSVSTQSSSTTNLSVYNNTFICNTNTAPGIMLGGDLPCYGTNVIANNIFVTSNAFSVNFPNAANLGLSGNDYYDIYTAPSFYWNTNSYASWGTFTNATKEDLTGFTNNPSLSSLAVTNNQNANTIQGITNYLLKASSPLLGSGLDLRSIFGFTMPATDATASVIPLVGYSVGADNSHIPGFYYVDTTNASASDSNRGTAAAPLKTINRSVLMVVPGDTVIVQPGEYNEFVTNATSGASGSPITFAGVRASDGSWLTTIDPSTTFNSGWVAAPEIGTGVWKQASMAFSTRELTIDHKRVAFVWTNGLMQSDIDNAYNNSGWSNGVQLLTAPANQTVAAQQTAGDLTMNFWDSLEAIYGTTNDPTFITYLRFRNGDNPNGMNIRCAPNIDAAWSANPSKPAIKISNNSYLIYSNLCIRGAFAGVYVTGASAHHNNIESNSFSGGWVNVMLDTGPNLNNIRNNYITANYYGYTNGGAWEGGTNATTTLRANIYSVSKFLMGHGSSFDQGIYLSDAGNSNVISGNYIYDGLGSAIYIVNDAAISTDTMVFSNTIVREPSCGIVSEEGQTGTQIYDNYIADCDVNIRYDHMDRTGETNRTVYIYRNGFWEPDGVGDHVYVHFYGGQVAAYYPTYWTYQNSYSGGRDTLNISGLAAASGGITNCSFLNNLMNSAPYASVNSSTWFWTNSAMVKAFDYNLVTVPMPTFPATTNAAWFGSHNITNATVVWANTPAPSFLLPYGSAAINAGVDIPTVYPTLPQDSTVKIGSGWDMGALEGNGPAPASTANTLHAGTLRSPP